MFCRCDWSLYVVGFDILVIVGVCVVVCVVLVVCTAVKTSVEDMLNVLLCAGSWLHVGCLTFFFLNI